MNKQLNLWGAIIIGLITITLYLASTYSNLKVPTIYIYSLIGALAASIGNYVVALVAKRRNQKKS